MKTQEIKIKNKLGLHARAAAKLVSTASHFDADVHLEKGSNRVNGKSIMGVMMLAASKGAKISVITDGDDEIHFRRVPVAEHIQRFGAQCRNVMRLFP